MTTLLNYLDNIWKISNKPFLINQNKEFFFNQLDDTNIDLSSIKKGDVVAIIGDFDSLSIKTLLRLCDYNVVIVPLTQETISQHQLYFDIAKVDIVIKNREISRINSTQQNHPILDNIRKNNGSAIIFFSSGTTGVPKAIVHDLKLFLKRYYTPRPALKTLSFLLFDHIGGINTLLHTLFNKGTVISSNSRKVEDIIQLCKTHLIELLPTTPTFLRMLLMSGFLNDEFPKTLKIITYGTEIMDQLTLEEISKKLPWVDFRQTYGMSELGILRVKSKARNSLFMAIGGEDIETKINNQKTLLIKSSNKMLGYLNHESPFDENGWYNTKDIVEIDDDKFIKIVGRVTDLINVGGLKFMPIEVENIALKYPNIKNVKVYSRKNPITGEHVEIIIETQNNCIIDKNNFLKYLSQYLAQHMLPKKIIFDKVNINHRFKKT